jgi:hypothetical protein
MARENSTYRAARRNHAKEKKIEFRPMIFDAFQAQPQGDREKARRVRQMANQVR